MSAGKIKVGLLCLLMILLLSGLSFGDDIDYAYDQVKREPRELVSLRQAKAKIFDLGGNKRRAVIGIADLHYKDGSGNWQDIDENFVGDRGGFVAKADKLRHAIRVADNGKRRWYPRRNVFHEYIEFERPEYRTQGEWNPILLSNPAVNGNKVRWTHPDFIMQARVHPNRVKFNLRLRNSNASHPIRWKVFLNGLRIEGDDDNDWSLVSEAENIPVGSINRPFIFRDGNGELEEYRPVQFRRSDGYVYMTPNLTGLAYPIDIDPTFTTQPGSEGEDTQCGQPGWSEENTYGSASLLIIYGATIGWNMFIRWDLSSIPTGSVVTAATMTLYKTNTQSWRNNSDLICYEISDANGDWIENRVCYVYKNKNTSTNWAGSLGCSTPNIDYNTPSMGTFEFERYVAGPKDAALDTSVVAGWCGQSTNNGMICRTADDAVLDISSSDHGTASWRPKLVVEYTPTLVELSYFRAKGLNGAVLLEWATETELDNEGFNLLRSDEQDGEYIKINPYLIPARGSAGFGAEYSYTDYDVENGVTYYYLLEDIDFYGVNTLHGPVSATPNDIIIIWPIDWEPLPSGYSLFSWTSSGNFSFKVDVSTNPSFPDSKTLSFPEEGWTSGLSLWLRPEEWELILRKAQASGGHLFWRIRAKSQDGEVVCSNWKRFIVEK